MYHFTFDFSKGIARVQHPAEISKDSDKCDSIKRFWFSVLMVVYVKVSKGT